MRPRDDLKTAIDQVTADVAASNFTEARAGLPDVQKAVDSMRDTAAELTGQQALAVQPYVATLRNSLGNLNYVTTLAQLKAGLAAVHAQLVGIDVRVTDALDCH